MARKKLSPSGVPEWLVTFADLMSLLVCFFVLIISFSIQDQEKLQVVAGSMKDAFGIEAIAKKSGVIERNGNPERDFQKRLTLEETKAETEFATVEHDEAEKQGAEANTYDIEKTDVDHPQRFSLASATLKQAFQDLPEITSISDNLIVQDTEEGVNLIIADQQGRSMFPEGSKYPYENTRKAVAAMAPLLAKMPNQIRVSGHTAAGTVYANPRYGRWELSADRANAIRAILEEFGVPSQQIFSVVGRGDAEPYFPDDPYLASNQRVSIMLVDEEPPLPVELTP
ncbi:OmpA/MotB family protein [Mariluticola halotolerans]|uniref:OmpA/MotB family protein n=1 Tax=Mariluticola halotolerans TaxID=2909283 RepID=UPI0026E1AD0D|nr:flagellar motor protein MotB [Mariluticola halotolerans]UJQ93940.1 flagellar motor protein MotB [Mariluticola halotolerans]